MLQICVNRPQSNPYLLGNPIYTYLGNPNIVHTYNPYIVSGKYLKVNEALIHTNILMNINKNYKYN